MAKVYFGKGRYCEILTKEEQDELKGQQKMICRKCKEDIPQSEPGYAVRICKSEPNKSLQAVYGYLCQKCWKIAKKYLGELV